MVAKRAIYATFCIYSQIDSICEDLGYEQIRLHGIKEVEIWECMKK